MRRKASRTSATTGVQAHKHFHELRFVKRLGTYSREQKKQNVATFRCEFCATCSWSPLGSGRLRRSMNLYDRYILPPLIDLACSSRPVARQRAKIVPQAEGVVLELGFGSGLNLPHYDASKVTRLYALEPSAGMLARAREKAEGASFPVNILPETAEALSLAPGSVDTVLVTYSLCTIPDPISALSAARRALKPGGRLLFCEHGRAPDEGVYRWQRRIEPMWSLVCGGCHLTRDIPGLVASAGYSVEKLDTMYLPKTPKWAGFNYWGEAKAI